MNKLDLHQIQNQIGYNFKNIKLLEQAFTRRSFSQENGGENNEVLEFIGDKVLDLISVKYLSDTFGNIIETGEYQSEKSEQELTELKKVLVQKKTLSDRIYYLDLEEYLKMGKGDTKNKVNHQESVKEDLFEAILGAVALDCNWNMDILEDVVLQMLNPEEFIDAENDYVSLIQGWCLSKYGIVPYFHIEKSTYSSSWYIGGFNGIQQQIPFGTNYSSLLYCAQLKLGDFKDIFSAWGSSKREARKQVCRIAYEEIQNRGLLFTIRDEIEEPDRDMAINQLEILARRGYFSIPQYDFHEKHDNNGNPMWTCTCSIKEENKCFTCKASSKKDAKKDAAYKMLLYVLEM